MVNLDDFAKKIGKEEINPTQKYPIIWKTEKCLMGECRAERTSHRWSVPASVPSGLMTECYDCHITRFVSVNSEPDLWLNNKPSDFVIKRLAELNNKIK